MDRTKMYVRDWMTQQPATVQPETSAVEAYERMRSRNIHRMPVVDTQGHLVGIVTRSDIEGAVSFRHTDAGWHEGRFALAGTSVIEVMTKDPLTVTPNATMRETATLMLTHHLSGLPVVEGSKLVGIITETDVFRMVVDLCAE